MRSRLIISLLAIFCIGSGTAFAATLYVPAEYSTIQAGIDAATDGDTVLVADGTYTGIGNKDIDFGGRAITLKSENGPENCIIDGQGYGLGFYFHNSEGPFSVLDGFTITNFSNFDHVGGGYPGWGGGIYLYRSSPNINNCNIIENTAATGGGIACYQAAPFVENCKIMENSSTHQGGGIRVYQASPTFLNCVISQNWSGRAGGGIDLYASQSIITNCTVTGNAGNHPGGGISTDQGNPTVTNCIVWANSSDQIKLYRGEANLTYCDIQGGWPGEGNIDADPQFVDTILDLHLTGTSPCINSGNNDAPNLSTTDMDGLPRIIDDIVDMGAYEFPSGPVFPDVSGCIKFQGLPLVEAEVRLNQRDEPRQITTTGPDGCYEFQDIVQDKDFNVEIECEEQQLESGKEESREEGIKSIFSCLCCLIAFVGCASQQKVWVKPGAVEQDFLKDKYESEHQAMMYGTQMVMLTTNVIQKATGIMLWASEHFNECMAARGWRLVSK